MRNFLNVIADILTLVAVAVSGVGHVLPWFRADPYAMPRLKMDFKDGFKNVPFQLDEQALHTKNQEYMEFQAWHVMRSGPALGVLALLTALSLAFPWGAFCRRILVLLMFASAVTAIFFIAIAYSPFPFSDGHRQIAGQFRESYGFLTSLIPACVAAGICLIRMIWTMPPQRARTAMLLDSPPAVAKPIGD